MLREFTVGRRPGEGAIIKEAGDVILRTRPSWRGHDQEFLDKNINGEELLFTFRHRVGLSIQQHNEWMQNRDGTSFTGMGGSPRDRKYIDWDSDWGVKIETNFTNDTVSGTDLNDWISSGNGRDSVSGGGGNDVLRGGGGRDTVKGGDGDDWIGEALDTASNQLWGGKGNDTIVGGENRDWIAGGDDKDYILGQGGDDVIGGGNGDDTISGQRGNDIILGGSGNDDVKGGHDRDILFGGNGFDTLNGGFGDDRLNGGADVDELVGGSGNDRLWGGAGANMDWLIGDTWNREGHRGNEGNNDVLKDAGGTTHFEGGWGADVFYINRMQRQSTIVDFVDQGDKIILEGAFNKDAKYFNTFDGDDMVLKIGATEICRIENMRDDFLQGEIQMSFDKQERLVFTHL